MIYVVHKICCDVTDISDIPCITVVGGLQSNLVNEVVVLHVHMVPVFLVGVGIVLWFHPGKHLLVAIACIEFF